MTKFRWSLLLAPLLLLLLFAPFSESVDLSLSGSYYHPETNSFSNTPFYEFIYQWGQLPAHLLSAVAGVLFLLSLWIKRLKPYRIASLILCLSMLLGPGLLTNGILKPLWGRPRPRQITEFGGHASYLPFWKPNPALWRGDVYKSMPSGHSASGFYFLTLTVIGIRYRNRLLIFTGVLLAALFGTLLGMTRIAQGGHFFSDVLVALILTWWVALLIDFLLPSTLDEAAHR